MIAFHFGLEGSVANWNYVIKISYSKNYGTFKTSLVYHTFKETNQLSTFFEVNKELKRGLIIGCLGAFDAGKLYDNSHRTSIQVFKNFLVHPGF